MCVEGGREGGSDFCPIVSGSKQNGRKEERERERRIGWKRGERERGEREKGNVGPTVGGGGVAEKSTTEV